MMECNGNGMSKPNEHDHLKISLPYSLWDTTNPTAVLWMPTVIFQLARELNYMGRCFADSTSPRCWNGALGGTAGIWQALRISCTFQTHSASKGKTLLISTAQNKQAHHKVGGDGGRRNSATHWTECTIEKDRVSICSTLHRKCTNLARALYTQQQQQHATPKALSVAPELPTKSEPLAHLQRDDLLPMYWGYRLGTALHATHCKGPAEPF